MCATSCHGVLRSPKSPRYHLGLGRSEIATESTRRTALEGLAGASSQLTFGELYEPPSHPLLFFSSRELGEEHEETA